MKMNIIRVSQVIFVTLARRASSSLLLGTPEVQLKGDAKLRVAASNSNRKSGWAHGQFELESESWSFLVPTFPIHSSLFLPAAGIFPSVLGLSSTPHRQLHTGGRAVFPCGWRHAAFTYHSWYPMPLPLPPLQRVVWDRMRAAVPLLNTETGTFPWSVRSEAVGASQSLGWKLLIPRIRGERPRTQAMAKLIKANGYLKQAF